MYIFKRVLISLMYNDVLFIEGFIESWYLPDYAVTLGYSREQGAILLSVIRYHKLHWTVLCRNVYPVYASKYIDNKENT